MTQALLQTMARPIGLERDPITFEGFLRQVRPFKATALAAGLTTFAWKAWRGDFPTEAANALSIGHAGHMAALALAAGALDGREPTESEIVDLHFQFLAIDTTAQSHFDRLMAELAKLAMGDDIAVLVPDLDAARRAVTSLTFARMLRVQWLPSRTRFDELARTWWMARQLDARVMNLDRAERMLGMPVPIFVRAATALSALAVTSEPEMGRVDLNRPIDQEFVDHYGVDAELLRLAAYKLSTSRDDLITWMADVAEHAPPELQQHAPSPLLSTPLLRGDELVNRALPHHTLFLCPSIYHFLGAVRDRVRDAISEAGDIACDVPLQYGELLNQYIRRSLDGAGEVVDLDKLDGDERRADWLVVRRHSGLIVEVKRSLATGALSKHLVSANGMAAVLRQLYGAYGQCRATYGRANWEPRFGRLATAAIVVVDEPVAAEGAVLGELLARQTEVGAVPPFEVMSVSEFENAVHALGVERLVSLIHEKWRSRQAGLPLCVYWTTILKRDRIRVDNVRRHLEDEDKQLFLTLGLAASNFHAEWPL